MNNVLDELKIKLENLDGIHCVIGNRYCSYKEEGYKDEFYINSIAENDIQIYYDKVTYEYTTFNEMINDKIFNGKSIKELANNIFWKNKSNLEN